MHRSAYSTQFKILKAVFIILAILTVCYAFYYNSHDTVQGDSWDYSLVFMEDWTTVDENGVTQKVDLNREYGYDPTGSFAIEGVLPELTSNHTYICFLTVRDTEVYVDGKLRNDLKLSRDVHVIGGPTKMFYFFTPLTIADSGKTIKLVRHWQENYSKKKGISEIIVGTRADVYRLLFGRYGISLVLNLVLFCASIVIIIVGFVLKLRMKLSVNVIYAGLAVMMTCAWLITDSYFYPFFFGHYHIDGLLSYLICLLLPVPYIAYSSKLQNGRHERFYLNMYIFILANFFVWTILHFTGVFKFFQSLFFIDGSLVLIMIAYLILMVKEYREGHIESYRYTAIGILGFMLFSMIEIIVIIIPNLNNTGNWLFFGMLFLLILSVGQQFEDLSNADKERKRAVELSDAKTNFLASMSHEIRTPINSILGMNEMILRENSDPDIASYARTVQNSGKMLLSLVNDVLDFSKIEAGRLEIMNEDYKLSSLLEDIDSIAKERAAQKGLEYEIIIDKDIPNGLNSDEFRIKQVLLNFVSNAVKYTDNGKITLRVYGMYESDDVFTLCFDVKDTGRGIKDEDKDHLFDAFSRIDLANNRSIEGTGLGLAIVKSIIDSMDGRISVESEYLNGSVFSVMIPQKVVDRTPIDPEHIHRNQSLTERHVCDFRAPEARVLAVDDNGPNLAIVKEFLKITEVRLDLCTNGIDAFKNCREFKYDLILLDHMMPEPDGIETLKMIRNDPHTLNRETKAIVLTANAVAGIRQMYIDAGFADYLTKPIESIVLEETVKNNIPPEKVIPVDVTAAKKKTEEKKDANGKSDANCVEYDDGSMEFSAVENHEATPPGDSIKNIPEIDYSIALHHCGGYDDIVKKVITEIVKDAPSRAELMRDSVKDKDYDAYRIGAHSIKGTMATIGAMDMSEKAKKHEFAVKEENYKFVDDGYKEFLDEFVDLCERLSKIL